MRLNYPVWREAMDKAKTAEQITTLLSIRAHIKGKVHRHRARLTWYTLQKLGKLDRTAANNLSVSGGSAICDLDAKDQAMLFENMIQPYLVIEEDGFGVSEKDERIVEAAMGKKDLSLVELFRRKLRQVF